MPAVSYQTIERRVRAIIRDTNPEDYVCDPDTLFHAVARSVSSVMQKLTQPPTLVTNFVALTANNYSYSVAYLDVDALSGFRLLSTGQPILKKDLPVLMQYRTGNPVKTDDPVMIAFSESGDGVLTAYVWPTPTKSDTIEATLLATTNLSDPLFNQSGTALYDSQFAAFDLPGQTQITVVYRAAAELVGWLDDNHMQKLGLNARAVDKIEALYRDALADDIARENRLRRSGSLVTRNAF